MARLRHDALLHVKHQDVVEVKASGLKHSHNLQVCHWFSVKRNVDGAQMGCQQIADGV